MDVLIVASEGPPIVSGISRCVGELSSGLRRRGHHVDVISSASMPRIKLGEYRFSSMLAYWPRIARELRRYDVVNLHGPVPTLSDVFLLSARTMAKGHCPPIVYTHHCAIDIGRLKRACRAYNSMHLALSSLADAVVTSSEWYAEPLKGPDRPPVEVIPWGVDTAVTGHEPRTQGPLRVLFVGQMRPYKGVDVLLRAVANLPEVELTLVGNGAHLWEYQRLTRTLQASNVKFLGRLPDEMLRAEYASNDVIVLPSTTHAEAFGLVVLEGMAYGCVPVVSNLPGVRDLAAGVGMVVPSGDSYELGKALRLLASDRQRLAAFRAKAGERVMQLGWDRCVDRYGHLFESTARRMQRSDEVTSTFATREFAREPVAHGL